MKKTLKIGIFHLGFFYSGGGERLVLEEAIGLGERGHEVEIFAPVVDKRVLPELQKKVLLSPLLPQLPRWFYDRETLLVLVSCVIFPLIAFRYRYFDVYLGANQPGPWFCWWLKKLFGKPYVIYLAQPTRILYPREIDKEVGLRTRRTYSPFLWVFQALRPLVAWADRVSVKGADVMLVNGEYAKENIDKIYGRKGVVCPAGTHPEERLDRDNYRKRFKGSLKVNGCYIKKPYVLVTNRHFRHKKFEYVLQVLLQMKKRRRFVITGEKNRYTRSLEKLARKKGFDKQVFFLGLVSEMDLERLYKQAACYVYTAPDEDFGMGIVEAMGYGVPVVAWRSGGPATIVKDGRTGLLAPFDDVKVLSKAIEKLLENKKLNEKMGLAAYDLARHEYSYEKHNQIIAEQLIAVVPDKSKGRK